MAATPATMAKTSAIILDIKQVVLPSTTNKTIWQLHLPLIQNGNNICHIQDKNHIYPTSVVIPSHMATTFSSDLEEAMTESGESLSNSKNYCSVFEKISKINDVKQNEKHPFTFNIRIWKGKCWILSEMGKI